MSEHKYQCIPPKNYISVWSCVLKHRSQNETVSLPRSSFLLHLFKASVLHATGLRDRPPGAHVHLHDGAFLLIEAAGGTMHCIWPSRFLRCKHGGAFPFVSAFHSLSAQSNQSDISSEPNPQHFLENNQSMAAKKNSEHVHDEV